MLRPASRCNRHRTYVEASPISHVSADDPPFLLMHGDKKLKAAGVPVKLLRIPGGGHGATFPGAVNPPDYLDEMVRWFDRWLMPTK
jgi:dipeptidyl aminopeptidase/acylaminoacyl peptidase